MRRLLLLAGSALWSGAAAAQSPAPPPSSPVVASMREVATRAQLPFNLFTSYNSFMSRSIHVMKVGQTSLQVLFPNFYVSAANGEVANGAAATINASVEYPIGATPTQMVCGPSGAALGTVASGGLLYCSVALAIPTGGKFAVREHYVNSAGIPYVLYQNTSAVAGIDTMTFGASVADQTGGGTVAATLAQWTNYPAAIVGISTQPAVCLLEDSRGMGYQDGRNDATDDGGDEARAIGRNYAYMNWGTPSDTAAGTIKAIGQRVALSQFCTSVVDGDGEADLIGGATATATASARTALAALFPGKPVYGTTFEPFTSSTDSWATLANQTVAASEAQRVAFNALARAGIAGETNVIDIAAAIDPTGSGLWPVNGTANYYTSDGLHGNTPAEIAIERAPVWSLNFTP